nr:hypothetical protein [uncultured Sphaerochaeta sp.]
MARNTPQSPFAAVTVARASAAARTTAAPGARSSTPSCAVVAAVVARRGARVAAIGTAAQIIDVLFVLVDLVQQIGTDQTSGCNRGDGVGGVQKCAGITLQRILHAVHVRSLHGKTDGEASRRGEHIIVVVALVTIDAEGLLDRLEAASDIIIGSHHDSSWAKHSPLITRSSPAG